MKASIKTVFLFITGMVLFSCNSYLDINSNPNAATSSTPSLLLSSALAGTASVLEQFNVVGVETGGYAANAGGYGGFNEFYTYAYTNSTFSGIWGAAYSNLENYQVIVASTSNDASNIYFNAVANIMIVHDFQLLVDEYNDVPYTTALSGLNNLTPVYDKGEDIYQHLAAQLDAAIANINNGMAAAIAPASIASSDVLFGGDMKSWIKLANTLKLKLMVRAKGKVNFANTTFDPVGFLTEDALINPGYRRDNGRQNPKWDRWAWDYSGTAVTKSWMPSTWILSFYDGTNLSDDSRGFVMYYQYSTGTAKISNQLGFEKSTVPSCPDGTFWYSDANRDPGTAGSASGAMKGPDAGYPLITAAESYFLQAEGALKGISLPGSPTDAASFDKGIAASFQYLYSLPDGTQPIDSDYASDATDYQATNAGNYLANYALATTQDEKLEAIITQKYIALNFIHSHEGWNEYRRTGYPSVTGSSATSTFASIKSQSTRQDKLPTRLLYPVTEARYNPVNTPQDISPFTSLIFWAK